MRDVEAVRAAVLSVVDEWATTVRIGQGDPLDHANELLQMLATLAASGELPHERNTNIFFVAAQYANGDVHRGQLNYEISQLIG